MYSSSPSQNGPVIGAQRNAHVLRRDDGLCSPQRAVEQADQFLFVCFDEHVVVFFPRISCEAFVYAGTSNTFEGVPFHYDPVLKVFMSFTITQL